MCIRDSNKIPTYKEQDAIYSYHFYRLLQRAKNVHLIYNTEADVLKGGEKSRFIRQLEFEGIHKINHKIINSNTPKNEERIIEITKTEEIINDLKNLGMPISIILGSKDRLVDLKAVENFTAIVPSNTYTMNEVGHFSFFEDPVELSNLISKIV